MGTAMLALPRTARSTIEVSFVSFGLISTMRAPLTFAIQSRPLAGLYRGRRADGNHAVGHAGLSPRRAHRVFGYGLPKHHGVVLDRASAGAARRGRAVQHESAEPFPCAARRASQAAAVSMDLDEVGDSGAFVEAVDVLCNYGLQRAVR